MKARTQDGAALLTAMLVLTLVATLAAGALWRQWRQVEVESAERGRQQTAWLLVGAQDWARLILREDARSASVDHLAEPWAVPLQEARLSSFLSVDKQATQDELLEAFLSGRIVDQQGLLNVRNLIENDQVSEPAQQAFERLFRLLGLPQTELERLTEQLQLALEETSPAAPLLPQRVDQLGALGLSPGTLARLRPYTTLLPEPTPVNLNTASAEVLHAVISGLDLSQARSLVQKRNTAYFRSLDEATRQLPGDTRPLNSSQHSVSSRYFEIQGRLRRGALRIEDHALVRRNGTEVRTLWRWHPAPVMPAYSTAIPLQ